MHISVEYTGPNCMHELNQSYVYGILWKMQRGQVVEVVCVKYLIVLYCSLQKNGLFSIIFILFQLIIISCM